MSDSESIDLAVERFLVHKRALGRKYLSEQAELRLLVAFAQDEGVVWLDELTPALLDDFLARGPARDHGALTISSASSRVCSTGPSTSSCS